MKYYLLVIFIACSIMASAQTSKPNAIVLSPLSDYSAEWNNPIYTKCNTAANATYMNKTERDIIYILNIIRSYPAQFANNVLKNSPHTLAMLTSETWNYPYTREQAAFPLDYIAENKFWPSVSRVNNTYGDRNLICTCEPVTSYMETEA